MIKNITAGIAMMSALAASASGFSSLTFEMTDGTSSTIGVTNLTMTVENGEIIAVSNDSRLDIPLDKLAKFRFTNDPAAIDGIEIDFSLPVQVFDTAGRFIGSFDDAAAAVRQLPAGVYVMKSESQTFKTVVK